MLSQLTIPKKNNQELALDYEQLYAIGLKHVQQLSSKIWTDYNVHDPGITTLELLCYALTDLSYRASFPIADLLASETNNAEEMKKQFFTARQILPNRALTTLDYRKLLIDLPNVKNAWVKSAIQSYYADVEKGELLGTPTLYAEELINLPLFAARLKQDSPDPISRYLLAQLSNATRKLLLAYDGADPEAEPLHTQLVYDLNRIIQGDTFSSYVLSLLRNDTGQALATYKGLESQAAPLRNLLVRDLNLIIPENAFYREEWVKEFTATQSLIAQYYKATVAGRETENISDRLNRLILEDIYPESIARYHLSIENILDLPSFTAKLKQTSPDPVSGYLFAQLRDVTRQELAKYPGADSEAQKLHTLLIQDLNQIVQGDSIYEEPRFTGVALSPSTVGLIALQQQLNAANHRLNRLLLNDVYRLEIGRYHPLRTTATLQSIKKVTLAGLYDVIIDYEDKIPQSEKDNAIRDVKQRLHANRNLCEDFVHFTEVEIQSFQLCAELELTPDADVTKVNAAILSQVQQYLSPSVRFYTLSEMLTRHNVEEIFDGPVLDNGFIDDDELENAELREEIRLSDIISIIMDIEGVQAVRDIVINPEGNQVPLVNKWVIPVDAGKKAQLNSSGSRLVFYKRNMPVVPGNANNTPSAVSSATEMTNDLPIPLGNYRDLANYYSFQNHFPAIYGLSDVGLSSTADDKRKALAYQLKAYLLFFDQIMANYLAQLSHVKELFSLNPELKQTYFYQVVNTFADYNKIYATNNVIETLQTQNSDREIATGFDRRNRFLDHLISRFAERFHDFVNIMYSAFGETPERIIRSKCEFLSNYPTVSQERSLAYNYNLKQDTDLWNTNNVSGLEKRLAKLLDIRNDKRRNLSEITYDIYAELDEEPTNEFRFRIRQRETLEIILSSSKNYDTREQAKTAMEKAIHCALLPSGYQRKVATDGRHYFNIINDLGEIVARRIEYFSTEAEMNQAIDELIAYLKENYSDEGMYLIENILLRPEQNSDPFLPICPTSNCTDCYETDPYSYRINIILPAYSDRFRNMNFRRFTEQVIREETPAHILPKICWIDKDNMAELEKLYRDWIYLKAGVEKVNREEKLRNFIQKLFAVKNVYPQEKIRECDSGENQRKFILGRTILGSSNEG
ncbi:hypothetical protein [Calothrix sp. NIES-2098]|uniref:hypothetical protein n=1 Tax=Calothrix sp. NIES-2098 TaxID=1954171 RepID=UPI000B5E2F32|nr:hypothetical protein NIES2098_30520 [Calothrix sp. NIES-2098]